MHESPEPKTTDPNVHIKTASRNIYSIPISSLQLIKPRRRRCVAHSSRSPNPVVVPLANLPRPMQRLSLGSSDVAPSLHRSPVSRVVAPAARIDCFLFYLRKINATCVWWVSPTLPRLRDVYARSMRLAHARGVTLNRLDAGTSRRRRWRQLHLTHVFVDLWPVALRT